MLTLKQIERMGVFYSVKYQIQLGAASLAVATFLVLLGLGNFFTGLLNHLLVGAAVPLVILGISCFARVLAVWHHKEPMTFEPSRMKYIKEPLRPAYVYFGDIAYKCKSCGRELKSEYVACPYCGTPTR